MYHTALLITLISLSRVFLIFDDDRSGSLNEAEFKKGLNEWCRQIEDESKRLTDEQIDEVFKTFDRDGNGTISYNEFLRTLRVSDVFSYRRLPSPISCYFAYTVFIYHNYLNVHVIH